jgi:hypothetical protein
MNRIRAGMVVALVVWGAVTCCAQDGWVGGVPPPLPALEEVHPLQEAVFPLLIPMVFHSVQELRTMLHGEEFRHIRARWGDRYAVDVAFRWAEQLCWNNRAVSLLVVFLAVIDHRTVGFRIPLLGPVVWLPLTGEFPDEFTERVQALPAHPFPDSPPGGGGDRDKLQHFFGSAFLAYVFGGSGPAERVGDFIEWGEDAFVVDGGYDPRDLEANERGRRFAARLREDREALPSGDMQVPLAIPQRVREAPE